MPLSMYLPGSQSYIFFVKLPPPTPLLPGPMCLSRPAAPCHRHKACTSTESSEQITWSDYSLTSLTHLPCMSTSLWHLRYTRDGLECWGTCAHFPLSYTHQGSVTQEQRRDNTFSKLSPSLYQLVCWTFTACSLAMLLSNRISTSV